MHSTPTHMVFKSLQKDVVMFNQQVSNSQSSSQIIGKVDEIMGPIKNYLFTVTPSEGIKPNSMKPGQKIYIDKAFFLSLEVFTNPQKRAPRPAINKGFGGKPGFSGSKNFQNNKFNGNSKNKGSFRGARQGNNFKRNN